MHGLTTMPHTPREAPGARQKATELQGEIRLCRLFVLTALMKENRFVSNCWSNRCCHSFRGKGNR